MKCFTALSTLVFVVLLIIGCGSSKTAVIPQQERHHKEVVIAYQTSYTSQRVELRGVWWPTIFRGEYQSRSTEENKRVIRFRLDQLQALGVNAVFFQVRAEGDAWYHSTYEPWSTYLTGTAGKIPFPYWDPLAFMIQECHKRHIELHAWINPYRASSNIARPLAPTHPYFIHPEWFVHYGRQLLFNPALPEVRNYTCRIIEDIVKRYDVDGIHLDDYFYPYPQAGVSYKDHSEYTLYGGRFASKSDFRRENVNLLIEKIHATIKSIKPYVQFGISPFGIYRNKKTDPEGSETSGLQNYDDLYADVILWVKRGWVDYIAPQLYWEMGHKAADYTELAFWWEKHIKYGRYYIGQSIQRTMQVGQLHPKMNIASKVSSGVILWPLEDLVNNFEGIMEQLKRNYWTTPALTPPLPYPKWLQDYRELKRDASLLRNGIHQEIIWAGDIPNMPVGTETKHYIVYSHFRDIPIEEALQPQNIVAFTHDRRYSPPSLDGTYNVAFSITRIDRYNHEHIVAYNIYITL